MFTSQSGVAGRRSSTVGLVGLVCLPGGVEAPVPNGATVVVSVFGIVRMSLSRGCGGGGVVVGGAVLITTTLYVYDVDVGTRSAGRRNFIFAAIGRGPVASVGGRGHSDAY